MAVDSSMQRIRRLTPLEAILGLLQSRVRAILPRRAPLAESTGAVLAEDVISSERPPRAIALRDGFAVAAAEIADAGPYAPVTLSLTRRIDAGNALPSGTDAVAPLDAITLRGDRAEAIAAVTPGDGVLQSGGDAAPGAVLRGAGQRLRAFDLAVLGVAGVAAVTIRSPRIMLVRSSAARAPMLDAAHATLARHIVQAGGVAHETTHSFAEAVSDRQCDAVIGIGGTGSGRRDDAVQDLARLGQVAAHGIAISPGETAALGFVGELPVLLVPGRLDAALAVWLLIGRQLLAKLADGRVDDTPATLTLRRKVASSLGMTELVPMRCNGGMAEPLGSGYLSLTALAHSDGWIAVPADSEGFAAGNQVAVNLWP